MNNASPTADLEAVKKDLSALREDLAALSRSILRKGARTARDARTSVEESVTKAADEVDHFVEERPYTTIAMAFVAGLFAAALVRRL